MTDGHLQPSHFFQGINRDPLEGNLIRIELGAKGRFSEVLRLSIVKTADKTPEMIE
jgi:hypothetical protein